MAKLVKNKKVIVIDFDFINNGLRTVFGICKLPNDIKEKIKQEDFLREFKLKESNLSKLIVKVNRNIDCIVSSYIIFDEKYIINKTKIKNVLDEFKKKYDLVLIDTSIDTKYREILSTLINLSDKTICISEGNIVNIEKTKNILRCYENGANSIQIVYNKKSNFTVSKCIFKIIFFKQKLISILHYDDKYNKVINKNIHSLYITKRIKREFRRLIDKL